MLLFPFESVLFSELEQLGIVEELEYLKGNVKYLMGTAEVEAPVLRRKRKLNPARANTFNHLPV